jgi:hypothetical protein
MKIFNLIVSLLFASGIFAQSPKLQFEYLKALQLHVSADQNITTTYNKPDYYYCAAQHNQSCVDTIREQYTQTIYKLNTLTGNTDSFQLAFPLTDTFFRWSFSNIVVNDRYIGIRADRFYVFDKRNGKLLNAVPHYRCEEFYFLDGTKVLLTKNYNSHPNDDSIKSKFMIVDFNTGAIEHRIIPDFKYIIYTHFVNNFVEATDHQIAFAQAIPYSINFYDTKMLRLINTINTDKLYNSPRDINLLDDLHNSIKLNHNAKNGYYSLKQIDSSVNRIEKILLLTEDTLLVSRYFGGSKFDKRKLDVWVLDKKTNTWNMIIYDQLYNTHYPPNYEYTITKESLPLDLTFSDKLIRDGNQLFLLSTKVAPEMGIQNTQRKVYEDKFYETHDLNYYLWLYKWDIK